MELTEPIANTRRLSRGIDLRRSVGVVFTTVVALLIISGIGFYVALRSGTVVSFDTHLTLDGRHALVIQNDMPCVPEEPPQGECGNAGGRREFKVLYSTLENDKVLFAVALPER
jgi:hypothetical protein